MRFDQRMEWLQRRGASADLICQRRQAEADTLTGIRNIGAKISTDKNRPSWVDKSAPLGAHLDQFLHAHYYQRTFDRGRADYETHFTRNRKDTDAAEHRLVANSEVHAIRANHAE
ncbi:hypothetical protein [Rhizobium laguerreae]|uniref:hypothetical protein n=1 Tax=Rhizobium laguerreae TaxID=1076926 RepID=UPI001C9153A9|nr:hypothetical protein [Rhizobium laguerreae]MBY3447124.1 hypothetical protein [Rhizobium laguerreae]